MDVVDSSDNLLGLGLALIAGFVYPFCALTSRMLKEVPTPVVVVYHTVGGLVLTSLFIIFDAWLSSSGGFRFAGYSAKQYGICLAASLFDTVGLICFTVAYQADKSGFVALISFMNIVYAYICDQIFFDERLNAIEFTAALSILLIAIGVAVYKLRL